MPVDPREDNRYHSAPEAEYPQLPTDLQEMVRDMLDEPLVERITLLDGEGACVAITSSSGIFAASVVNRLVDEGMMIRRVTTNTDGIMVEAHEPPQ